MHLSARLGRFELCRAIDADRTAARRTIASAGDALGLLRLLRCDASLARALVHAVGARAPLSRSSDDALRALSVLLWRGTYVLIDLGPGFRVPPLEAPPHEEQIEEPEPPPPEEPDDGHPPAIVPPEYPRVAGFIMSGLFAATDQARRTLDEQLYRGLAPIPVAEVPDAYRDIGKDKQLELKAAAHHATQKLERMLHAEGELGNPTDTVPGVYRDLADVKRTQVQQSIVHIASSLDRLLYAGDTDLAMAEGTLHSNALPPVLRENTDVKVRAVVDSTTSAASRLDVLLYDGFE